MNYAYVDETVLQQLVRDTDAEIVPELLMLYIEDSEKRMSLINDAITNKDFETLEFETHTVGSSAAAHGNTKLYMAARQIEQLCLEGNTEQAIEQASGLSEIANESFRLLAKRASQGFEK